MVLVRAVAEIEAEHVGAGMEQRGNLLARRRSPARASPRSWRCVVVASPVRLPDSFCRSIDRTRMARKSLTLVSVGPVTTRSPSAGEEPIAIIVGQACALASTPERGGAGEAVGRRAARRHCPRCRRCRRCRRRAPRCPDAPSSATASASRNSALRPPRPWPRTVTVVSPPESSTRGRRQRLAVARDLARDPGMDQRDVARLALDASPRMIGRSARFRARRVGGGLRAPPACVRDDPISPRGQARVAGLRRLVDAGDASSRSGRRRVDPVFVQTRARVREVDRIGARSGRSRSPTGRRPARRRSAA